jgi:hypothetical protein
MRLNDPNSEEYKAKQAADWAEYVKKQNYAQGLQTAAENNRQKKEDEKANALIQMLTTPKTVDVTTTSNNKVSVDTMNKANKALEAKAAKYGDILRESIEKDSTIKDIENKIASTKSKLAEEEISANVFGGETSPNINKYREELVNQNNELDDTYQKLDEAAKRTAGITDNYQRNFYKVPELKETTSTSTKALTRDEWLKQALPKAKGIGVSGITTAIKAIDELYPVPDKKEINRLKEDEATSESYKSMIKAITGKEAVGTTKTALKDEYETVSKSKKDYDPKDVLNKALIGLNTGADWTQVGNDRDEGQQKVVEAKANNPKLTDSQLAQAVKYATYEDGEFDPSMFDTYILLYNK